MPIEKYLYEIIEDYNESTDKQEKENIFKSFCCSLWESDNERRTTNKTIRFTVKKELLHTEIGKLFDSWSIVEYRGYKSMTSDTGWTALLRQKINNLYTTYCDRTVVLNKEYLALLGTPKSLYYQWISGTPFTVEEVTGKIDIALENAQTAKEKYQKQKMPLSWSEYKTVIEGFLLKCFNNCSPVNEYKLKCKINPLTDLLTEDNIYIRYFCKSIEGDFKKYQKAYYGVKEHKKYKRCEDCGGLMESTGNRKTYCLNCAQKRKKLSNKKADQKYKKKRRENRKSDFPLISSDL